MTPDMIMPAAHRDWFEGAATGALEVVSRVTHDDLQRPGLGVWTVRDLIGHTARAFLTIETYLGTPSSPEATQLPGSIEYFRAALGSVTAGNADEVAERGRAAGRALGDQPVTGLADVAQRVRALVAATPDDAPVATPFGTMTLASYLPTRAFEITVHGLDLAAALETPAPQSLTRTAPHALALCTGLAAPDLAVQALLALTGRRPLPQGFSLL